MRHLLQLGGALGLNVEVWKGLGRGGKPVCWWRFELWRVAKGNAMTMAWLFLVAAGVCEIVWAAGLKKYGFVFTSVGGVGTMVVMILSFVLLSRAMKDLPLGTSYAIWTGIGAAGTAVVGVWVMGESGDWKRLGCIGLILAGVVGLKLLSGK